MQRTVCTVYLTQNLPNYYATLGAGEEGKASADSLLANLNTKIFHANSDPVTNEWAATLIGRSRQFFVNASNSQQPSDWLSMACGWRSAQSASAGISEVYEYEVPPRRFTSLRKGGAPNGGLVDAIAFQGGRRFHETGKTWLPVIFQQQFQEDSACTKIVHHREGGFSNMVRNCSILRRTAGRLR
jgi:hypothetical protein